MEKIITLTHKEYEELLKYKSAVDQRNVIYTDIWNSYTILYTENETIEKLAEIAEQLSDEVLKLKSRIAKFKNLSWYKRIFYTL